MNNGIKNNKKIGVKLLSLTQVLYQNNAITTEQKDSIASFIQEGMKIGTFDKLKILLFDILETTPLPMVVEDMIMEI